MIGVVFVGVGGVDAGGGGWAPWGGGGAGKRRGKLSIHNTEVSLVSVIQGLQQGDGRQGYRKPHKLLTS